MVCETAKPLYQLLVGIERKEELGVDVAIVATFLCAPIQVCQPGAPFISSEEFLVHLTLSIPGGPAFLSAPATNFRLSTFNTRRSAPMARTSSE